MGYIQTHHGSLVSILTQRMARFLFHRGLGLPTEAALDENQARISKMIDFLHQGYFKAGTVSMKDEPR